MADVLEADFVIVGGGSSGCALAARLSADPACSVILLEAGDRDRSLYIHLPVTYYKTTGSAFSWGYETAPQKHQGDIRTPYTQARVIGGGSSINAQIYIRGNPQDFDGWRDDHGCTGWGYQDVLPYFVRAEGNQRLAGKTHGTDGPLLVSDPAYVHPLSYSWLQACQQAGLEPNEDFNSGTQAGCGLYQVTNRAGRRSSTANCYLRPALDRPNLRVITSVQARRVVFENRRAAGVEVDAKGGRRTVRARREVILTAGAIGTPKLLMLSGIGPAAELKAHGIEVVRDSPNVGRNLQDHLDIFMIYEVLRANSYDKYKKLHWQAWAGIQFGLFRSGPITSNVVEAGAFWWSGQREGLPDVQFHFLAGAGVEAGIPDVPGGAGCTLNAYLVRPKSRGSVTLRSAEPSDHPVIDPNFLDHPDDLEGTIASVRLGRKIMAQAAMQHHIAREHYPGTEIESEAELEAFVRAASRTGYHPSCTCRMGEDEAAVVDTGLRVRGVDGLRISDASVMPQLVSGNTNATTIMIAERAADMILGNRGLERGAA
ncbi:Choline dehydrogenase [Pseudoxanthobacter soli DSM 19599]|uniref:Choline dehydrogenase n=1 Tax=Pseudoxanthobacter soli DSM 19599 TaxID=1123029 RepID=A0A1M7ZLI3_9HYPH|nr:GMC family oxidoreductase N-terminal domain-containing protein [Pseudoxanthobacter soli]SHO65763.1 Choline dehydrogenase [Pseudoxanthobacter soli DSM 19599]